MIDNLEEIYDPAAGDEDPKPKPKPARRDTADEIAGLAPTYAHPTNIDVNEYIKYMPEGVYEQKGLDSLRGNRQSALAQLGIRTANLVPNIAASVIDMIGYTGALLTEGFGDERDYSNAFTKAAETIRNPFGDTYRHDNSTWALGDSAWWIDNVFNLAEFALPAVGQYALVSRGMMAVAEGATNFFNLTSKGVRIANAGAKFVTAGFTAYTEAAMDGANVFDEVYKAQQQRLLAKGLDPEEAHKQATHIAAQNAASTVQLSTAMTTLLNLSAIAPYFSKADDTVRDVLRTQGKQGIEESIPEWYNRIKSIQADDVAKKLYDHYGVKKYLSEALQEGGEEIGQYFAEQTGKQEGKEGKTHGFFGQFGQLEKFFDRTMNAEGGLAFALGAVGGTVQTALINGVIPGKRTSMTEDGTLRNQKLEKDGTPMFRNGQPVYETKWVTPRTYDQWNVKHKFNSLRDAFAEDIKNFRDKQTDYFDAVKANDPVAAEDARMEMFNVAQVHAVTFGMADVWRNTYEQIQGYDNEQSLDENDPEGPTEAMQKGYAKDRTDNEYQAKAKEAISDLNKYEEEYNKISTRYGTQFEANQGTKELADMMFNRKVRLMSGEKLIKNTQQEIAEAEKEEAAILHMGSFEDYDQSMIEYEKVAPVANRVRIQLQQDLAALENTKSPKEIKRLIRKYQAKGMSAEDTPGAINDLKEKLTLEIGKRNQIIGEANEMLLNSTGYNAWLEKNTGKSFDDYKKEMRNKYILNSKTQDLRSSLEYFQVQHNEAANNYKQLWDERSVAKWAKKLTDWNQRLHQARIESEGQTRAMIEELKNSKETDIRLAKLDANQRAEQQKKLLNEANEQLKEKERELAVIVSELEKSGWDPIKRLPLEVRKSRLKTEIKALEKRITLLESMYQQSAVDTATEDIAEDDLLNEKDGLDEQKDTEDVLSDLEDVVDQPLPEEVSGTTLVVEDDSTQGNTQSDLSLENEQSPEEDKSASKIYQDAVKGLPKQVKRKLDEIETNIRATTFPGEPAEVSLDALGNYSDGPRLLRLLKEYIDETNQVNSTDDTTADLLGNDNISPDDNASGPPIDITGPGFPDTPVITNGQEDTELTLPVNNMKHVGKKITNSLSAANKTHLSVDGINEQDNKFFQLIIPHELITTSNPNLLLPEGFPVDTPIRFEVDTKWDGTINDDNVFKRGSIAKKKSRYADYLISGTDRIDPRETGNVPIKIVHAITGELVGYVRRADYLHAKFEGTEDGSYKQFATEQEGGLENLEEQTELLLEVRRAIVSNFKNGQITEGKTGPKGFGTVILNRELQRDAEGTIIGGSVKEGLAGGKNGLIPGNVRLGIVSNGKVYDTKQNEFAGKKNYDELTSPNGTVVMMIPGANGEFTAAPLRGMKLSDHAAMLQSVVRAIELYLLYDGTQSPEQLEINKELDKVDAATGFDLRTHTGLQNFIKQYFTHLNPNFSKVHTSVMYNKDKPERTEQFMLNVWNGSVPGESKNRINAGITSSGIYADASIVNGKLDQRFVAVLERGFQQRSRTVTYASSTLRGINDASFDGTDKPFKEILYTKNGWKTNKYPSYNEFVKAWSKTNVYGKNKVNGIHVYVANPQIPFEVTTVPGKKKIAMKQNMSPTEVNMTLPVEEVTEEEPALKETVDTSLSDDLGDMWNSVNESRVFDKPVKPGVEDVFKETPQLSTIGTLEEYSQYLGTIFPGSRVQDIVYHISKSKIEKFDKIFIGTETSAPDTVMGFFFTETLSSIKDIADKKNKQLKELGETREVLGKNVNIALLNMQKPKTYNGFLQNVWRDLPDFEGRGETFKMIERTGSKKDFQEVKDTAIQKGEDGIIGALDIDIDEDGYPEIYAHSYVVFEPEQIHVLGTQQDVQGFKQWKQSNGVKQVNEIGTAPSNSRPLTLQILDNIYAGTQQRNGLTPMEVFEDLTRRGHTFVPDGYNPFSKCL